MSQDRYDVIIIGAGHNGLTCAAYLASAGLRVLVLEKQAVVGGTALTEEFHPGFRNSVAAYTVSLLHARVIKDLQLDAYGLRIVERPVANFWPVDARRYLLTPHNLAGRQRAVATFSSADAERLPAYEAALHRAATLLREVALERPPNAGGGLLELIAGGKLARRLLALSADDKRLLVDLFTRSAADFLAQWFEDETVKGAMAFDGIVGAFLPPSTPGTAYALLHHAFGEVNGKTGVWGHAIGGMGAITQAMVRAAEARGVHVRTNAPIASLIAENGVVTGVRLESGEEIRAQAVAASVPPKLLFRDLMPAGSIDPQLHRRFVGITSGSGVFRMNVALAELPSFTCRPGSHQQDHHGAGIIIGPSLSYLEQAYQDACALGYSRKPVIEMLIPSTLDPTLAPPGRHVASLFVQYAAPQLPDGQSWDHAKDGFVRVIIDIINDHAPNFRAGILATQVLTPLDLEQRFSLPDGDIFHGRLSLGQLHSARPVTGFANYRMPLRGLYLCGAGAHPGGGVSGLPGRNAAIEIIRDFKGKVRMPRA